MINRAKGEQLLDYEVEWGFMLAKRLDGEIIKQITSQNIADYIAGVFLILDMTSREVQVREANGNGNRLI
ncbi:MAG: hypothetical protein HN353_00845 [Bdellovibrionales bacterium]|nr:hypothetical protein [Bdellovibrionales bacterium]MBT3524706.1 hypothetical protein [Bdellovibrionales bacterium]